ncbi:hypothetical protein F0562_004830 [Nyssa sinensis]|uniref:Rad21/Rec8-like protein C-terminal eukaryotic domain-containing protein n=1 Tax=Nyssa sinensis TaxID=561372 RepID=A0A5J5AM32_9ASTE|nr:hypothetical protein F0562_004830 [Nyssa sinensis]
MDGEEVPSPSPNVSNLGASMEIFRGKRFSSEYLDPMMLGEAEEEPDLVRPFGEEHQTAREQIKIVDTKMFFGAEKDGEQDTDAEKIECPEMISPESGNHQHSKQDCLVSITIDATPESKFPDASGAPTPEFIVVHTPATKECDKVSRKRRCFYDDFIVLPNQVLKQQMDNSTGLVCKRRKAPHTALCTWKASQISNLPLSFLEPLLPGISPELRSLFCKMKINTPEPVEHPPVHSSLDLTANARSTPVVEAPENANVLVSPTIQKSPDQTDIAPSTPVTHSTSVRLHEVPEISYSGRVGLASSSESIHKKLSPSEDQEFDISSLNEEENSGEGDKQEIDGWSVRTRTVVRCLHKNFLNGKKKRGNGVVNLLQVLKGKNRKESARVFFEILVLKTGGYVDVKQDNAYGDILVLKTPEFK